MKIKSPIHEAYRSGRIGEVIRKIVHGDNVDDLDEEGRTILFYAVQDGDNVVVAELIKSGANINAVDRNLETPLHFAARSYQPDAVELLLKSGADVNSQDAQGNTPLSRAVFDSKGRGGIINLLLSFGADKSLNNKHGISPEALAKSIANYDISSYFT